jgi:hypothetical protein
MSGKIGLANGLRFLKNCHVGGYIVLGGGGGFVIIAPKGLLMFCGGQGYIARFMV